jgi:hypothetical protein
MESGDFQALIVIAIVRVLVPLLVLRWPFWGALLCIAGDGFDTVVLDMLPADAVERRYHTYDKIFDTYYLTIEAWVVYRRWTDVLARRTGLVLYALRLTGVILFEITQIRQIFLIGSNIFENFYIYVAGRREMDLAYRIQSVRNLVLVLLFVGVPKLLQEYVMHYRESQTWHFVRDNILFMF